MRFYLLLCLAIAATVFTGFWFTYFTLVSGGMAGNLPPIVHLHGWSFFAWYLLLPLQAALVAARKVAWHRALGKAGGVIVAIAAITGLTVITVRIDGAGPDPYDFWRLNGALILTGLVLFVVFFALAIKYRGNPSVHKRYMIVASSAGMGAAIFRVINVLFGFGLWNVLFGQVLTNVFVLAGMAHDYRTEGKVHPAYQRGLVVALTIEALMIPLILSPLGGLINGTLAAIGRVLSVIYI